MSENNQPAISVVVPVYNRPDSLRRALDSVANQTLTDFECLVVDDASTVDLRTLVDSYDDLRFRYLRRSANGGPAAARLTGMDSARGEYTLLLDSDWELYPWTLDQARRHLDANPGVNMVCGLHVRNEDSRLFVRVRNAPVFVTPDQARREGLIPDRVVAVRRCVIDEWLHKDDGYFDFAAQLFLTAKLAHAQLYVDEPWTIYHTDREDRVTLRGCDEGALADMARFLREHRDLIDDGREYHALDAMLRSVYFSLSRARRPEAKLAAEALLKRGVHPSRVLISEVAIRIRRRLRHTEAGSTYWI